MRLKDLKKLIDYVSQKDFADFEIEHKGLRIRITRSNQSHVHSIAPAGAPLVISSHVQPTASELAARQGAKLISAQIAPLEESTPPRPETAEPEPAAEPEPQIVKAPIVGTFYRASSPNAAPFVRVGDRVEPDTVVCIIEAMKLMNEIQAEVSGEVLRIYVENGQPVEYGQPLFAITS